MENKKEQIRSRRETVSAFGALHGAGDRLADDLGGQHPHDLLIRLHLSGGEPDRATAGAEKNALAAVTVISHDYAAAQRITFPGKFQISS